MFIIILIDVFDKFEELRIMVKQVPLKLMQKIVKLFVFEFIQGGKLELFQSSWMVSKFAISLKNKLKMVKLIGNKVKLN